MTSLHLRRLALAVACLYSLAGHAEDSVDSRAERNFTPVPPSRTDKEGPVYIDADQMDGVSQKNIKARGSVHMRKQDLAVDADAVEYTDADTTAIATGNVVVDRAGDRATGPYLRLNVQTDEGYM
jgi:LPS-assembly protein